jgi:ABC-type Zn uptake system ZnuABC Zn-binding protein ZnuA
MIFLVILSLITGLQACQRPVTESDKKLRILTTIAPLYSFTINVVGDSARVDNLIPSGIGPHEYSLSPGDARKVAETRLLIINGVNLESWLHKLTSSAEEVKKSAAHDSEKLIVVDTSTGVEILNSDPHIWLSPINAIVQVKNIRDALVKADPDNSETFMKNADEYIQRLKDLDKEIRGAIKTWNMNQFVAFHSAFRYFAKEYGLEQIAVIQETPDIEPSPRHIAHVIETIRTAGIRSIFTEP